MTKSKGKNMMKLTGALIIILIFSAVLIQGKDQKNKSNEPTAEETYILELINRCRSEPSKNARRMINLPKQLTKKLNFDLFLSEMDALKPQPPIVFNLKLIQAARNHCNYALINNIQSHYETTGKKGFTGKKPTDRIDHVGETYTSAAENIGLLAVKPYYSPWFNHMAFVIDWNPASPNGMQPRRGHRRNIMTPHFNQVGVGLIFQSGSVCETHKFIGNGKRYAGGVIYKDKNKNHFYDIGEAFVDIEISYDQKNIKPWASGAFTIPIKNENGTIQFKLYDKIFTKPFEGGENNISMSLEIPTKKALDLPEYYLKEIKKISNDPKNKKLKDKKRFTLYGSCKDTLMTEKTRMAFDEETKECQEMLKNDKKNILDNLRDEPNKVLSIIGKVASKYRGTILFDWFEDAKKVISIEKKFASNKKLSDKGKLNQKRTTKLIAQLKAKKIKFKNHFWQKYYKNKIKEIGLLP